MWKRDQAVQPDGSTNPASAAPRATTSGPTMDALPAARDAATIGKSVRIKGELSGGEDLKIDGHVEGKVELGQHALLIGPNGRIKAEVAAKIVVVEGRIDGNISATERVDIRDSGSMEGDIVAPRVVIADGALFRGTVDMQRQGTAAQSSPPSPAERPTAAAGPTTKAAAR